MNPSHKYFPVNDAQKAWGIYATCIGHSLTAPYAEFPATIHPDEYFFTWDKGRILNEWQFILVEKGRGIAEFRQSRYSVNEGSLILIAPGGWHRYRPLKSTGWTTLWIGFGGDLAGRLVKGAGLSLDGDVLDVSYMHHFHKLLSETVSDVIDNGKDNPYSIAAKVPLLIATIIEELNINTKAPSHTELVNKAQSFIVEHATGIIDYEHLASTLGIPYRTFRHIFAKETGSSPHQYQLEIRLARAKNLLRSTDMPIADIAETLGFNSTWYFAHFFQKRCRTSAAAYRKKHGTAEGRKARAY